MSAARACSETPELDFCTPPFCLSDPFWHRWLLCLLEAFVLEPLTVPHRWALPVLLSSGAPERCVCVRAAATKAFFQDFPDPLLVPQSEPQRSRSRRTRTSLAESRASCDFGPCSPLTAPGHPSARAPGKLKVLGGSWRGL